MSGATRVLPWLLSPPADFRQMVKSIEASKPFDLGAMRRLAATEMDLDQLRRMAKMSSVCASALDNAGLPLLRLGLVGSHTLDYLPDALGGTALRHGFRLETVRADYGQVVQSVIDPSSALATSKVDAVLVSLDPVVLGFSRPKLDDAGAALAIESALKQMATLRDGIRRTVRAIPVFQTIPCPADPLFGSYDGRVAGSPRAMIEAFNARLAREIVGSGDLLIDTAFAAAQFGLERWLDPRGWHSAKLPFSLDAAPLHADQVCRVLGAMKGKSRKCLVLDLDNTLWSGVIGDDGVAGIKLGQGNALGEAHLAIQHLALDLRSRGIILAVCSKNEDVNARLPFREHLDMAIKEEHVACFVANWTDKATNLRNIAATLNIGVDSLVFLDDNPAEREIIRRELPEVAVPEVGSDPALYPGLLARAGYFEAIAFAAEDRHRAEMYQANAARLQAADSITNMEEYLESLDMVLTARAFDQQGRSRIAQLINKSNQFNLTTRRYTEADVAAFEDDPGRFTLQLRLVDSFGDNGMISVIIFDKGADTWSCDTWLMSCRVLGRRVEEACLDIVAKAAIASGASQLAGTYLPTAKNGLVEHHFQKLGFKLKASNDDGSTEWLLDLGNYRQPRLPMVIENLTSETDPVATV